MSKKKYEFQSEVNQLLDLMINSLYSNKEIFLRELISNASDAIDKLKFYLLTNKHPSLKDFFYEIKIYVDRIKKTLTISDNGIGMLEKEVIENLGTIAKSGAKDFLQKNVNNITKKNKDTLNIIGQFGVGFYSSFMVADKVKVYTRSIYESEKDNAILWESTGQSNFTVNFYKKDNYGTDVVLYIKDNCHKFLDVEYLKNIIVKYSNYVSTPIKIKSFNKKENKYIWEQINTTEVFWSRTKADILEKEYIDFYKVLTNNSLGNPLTWIHNKVEGKYDYISIFYIPDISPWEIWNRDEYKSGVKIYVRKIYIMDDNKKILPAYLRFVQGLIDFSDIPLNVSREIVQDNDVVSKISLSITKKILNMLNNLSLDKKKYDCFWKNFGSILKEGIAEDINNKDLIALLLRFNSTYSKDVYDYISLQEYLDRMKPGQDKIYYITADSYIIAKNSPHLESYNKRNIEVLLLCDKIDEWMLMYLISFKDINFACISKDNTNSINNTSASVIKSDIQNNVHSSNLVNNKSNIPSSFIIRVKDVLGDLVEDVRVTNRLEKFPVVLVSNSNQMSSQMVKLLVAAGRNVPKIKYFFDINLEHILIKYINSITDNVLFHKWIKFLFYQSYLIENNSLENPIDFVNKINDLMLSLII